MSDRARTERELMLAGELYDPFDPELVAARVRARDLCQALNASAKPSRTSAARILRDSSGRRRGRVWMQPPFYCDYGANIQLGERVFFNFNCVVLDVCRGHASATTRCSDQRCRSTPPMHPLERRASAERRSSEAGGDRFGRLGRRRRDHLSRRHHRLARR